MTFTPEIPDNSKVIHKVTKVCRDKIKETFKNYMVHGNNLYSINIFKDPQIFTGEHDGQEYKVEIMHTKAVNSDPLEWGAFQSIVFKAILGRMSFERDGRNMFNPTKAVNIQQLDIWPGFFSSMQNLAAGTFLQIDLANKVVRTDRLLQILQDYENKGKSQEQINEELKGTSVVTTYGTKKHSYRIESIDFTRSPTCSFKKGKPGEEVDITFLDYYKTVYAVEIRDTNQPLVVSKNRKTGQEVALIPELCQMTGLTDQQRANFNLMRDLAGILHKDGKRRLDETKALMEEIQKQEKVQTYMGEWGMSFDSTPVEVTGQKIPAGQIVMGNQQGFSADCNVNDFDRNIQKPMNTQEELKQWCIFYGRNSEREAQQLKSTFGQAADTFKYKCSPPAMFKVEGDDRRFETWEREMKSKLNPGVTLAVFILQGNKNGAPMYDQIKKCLITQMPVPSQVVLHNTISRGKNLRSIVNKILIQMNAKLGGQPWAVSDMPFTNKPTMVVGYDVFHKPNSNSYLAFCATTNRNFN